jgi:hypothetical protein
MKTARQTLACLVISTLLTLQGAAASAQDGSNDTRCFLVSNMFAKVSTDETEKEAAAQAAFFYLGRLNGPASHVETALSSEAKQITPENAAGIMAVCARTFADKAAEMQQIGERLNRARRRADR